MKTEIKIRDKVYKTEVFELRENLVQVTINGNPFFFTQDEFGRIVKAEKDYLSLILSVENQTLKGFSREKEIKSPIAGTVSDILVKSNDRIKPNQKVLTLISMKMENEIISESAGEIDEIRVRKNQFVNAGEILIVLK